MIGLFKAVAILVLTPVCAILAADWTPAVEVRDDSQLAVAYRARLNGDYLLVQATHEAGWHTIAMDNKVRAEEKLAGRKSLGIDLPTEIRVTQGLEVVGPWYQSPPMDASKPELLIFSWTFEKQAFFAAKVRRSGAGPAQVAIRGQACTETICRKLDVTISLPLPDRRADAAPSPVDLKSLVPVR